MPKYFIGKYNSSVSSNKDIVPISDDILKNNHNDSIMDYIKKSVASNSLAAGDIIYEARPIYKLETQVVAKKLKSL